MPQATDSLIDALQSPDAFPHATDGIELIETHISWVLLTGRFAYKIKKPVVLPFVDFSTLERRERFCRDELRLNRRLAPEIYVDVVPIGGTAEQPKIGEEPALEFAVRMHQFPARATADRLLADGELDRDAIAGLAERLARFHAELQPVTGKQPAAGIAENLEELDAMLADGTGLERIGPALEEQLRSLAATLAQRVRDGFVREGHGDLHLGNITRIGHALVPFDCLEFSRDLRTVDLMDELAFLYMDLMAAKRRDLASGLVDRYLAQSGDYAGLRLLRFFAAHRALVRAKVAVIAQNEPGPAMPGSQACRYFDAARTELTAADRLLLITCGLSGSGKSTIARQLAAELGAIQIRSDVERKRLHGLAATERSNAGTDQGLYSAEASAATYRRLLEAAESALAGRVPIIVDAAFLERDRREDFAALAQSFDAPFLILHCTATADCLRERLRQRAERNQDPSDADESILAHQIKTADALDETEAAAAVRIDTEQAFDSAATAAGILSRAQVSLSSTSY